MNTDINSLSYPVILYDGECNLCNNSVHFVIEHDKQGQFRFASLQSVFGRSVSTYFKLPVDQMDTFLLLDQGRIFQKSTAALMVLRKLGGRWAVFGILKFIPIAFRDCVYGCIAKNRYRWFGKKKSCLVPDKDLLSRFIVDLGT